MSSPIDPTQPGADGQQWGPPQGQPYGGQPYPPAPAPIKPRSRIPAFILGLIIGGLVGGGLGACVGAVGGSVASSVPDPAGTTQAPHAPQLKTTPKASDPDPGATITDGTGQEVAKGGDIEPGSYKTTVKDTGDATDLCIYSLTSDEEGQKIVDLGSGVGSHRIKLKAGQWFNTQGCGTWQRVK
jgi:hypothetical protein